MKYIIKQKDAKKYKEIDDLSQFNKQDFDRFELYEVRRVTVNTYDEKIKIQKIDELKKQLLSLGVDFNALTKKEVTENIETDEITETVEEWKETPLKEVQQVTSDSKNLTIADKHLKFVSSDQKLSKVINRATGKPFTMKELEIHFDKFKTIIEKDVPEVMFCSYSEIGFLLNMTEIKNNIPRMLDNGIPIKQVL